MINHIIDEYQPVEYQCLWEMRRIISFDLIRRDTFLHQDDDNPVLQVR